MSLKSISTILSSLFFALLIVFIPVFYLIRFSVSANSQEFYIETILGDESVMENINISATIGAIDYLDYSYMEIESTDFTTDINGKLSSKINNYNIKVKDYKMKETPNALASLFFPIVPKDAKSELIKKINDSDYGSLNTYKVDKVIPYFTFSHGSMYDNFLVVKPDYYVNCVNDTSFSYDKYITNNPQEQQKYREINTASQEFYYDNIHNLNVKIEDDYYMVLPTFDEAVGTNGIYKFKMRDEYIDSFFYGCIEGEDTSENSIENRIKAEEYRYEKLIDIPINVENENNKLVEKIFEHNGNIYLISTQKFTKEVDNIVGNEPLSYKNIYLSVYDIENNIFTKEVKLGELNSNTLEFHNNGDFLTIADTTGFYTYNLDTFEKVNETQNLNALASHSVYYNGENLYTFTMRGYSTYSYTEYNEIPNFTIKAYKGDAQVYGAELVTDVYQDYSYDYKANAYTRKMLSFEFSEKG